MNVSIMALWLPIVLATLLAWVASFLSHVVLKFHNADYSGIDNEEGILDSIRAAKPAKGIFALPYCAEMKDMADPQMQQRFERGPVAMITIFDNGMPPMGKLMVQQILFFLLGMFLVAYCASLALLPGANYLEVFRFVSATAFLTFGWAQIPLSIWFGHPWGMCARYLVDALVYALLAAGAFAWLWPAAV